MPDILHHVQIGLSRRVSPQTPEQYVALQVARALHDDKQAIDYLTAASRFPLVSILTAYRVLQVYGPPREHITHHFRTVLLNLQGHRLSDTRAQIVSFRIERRAVAVTVLDGFAVDLVQVRELPSEAEKADDSAVTFIRRILDDFPGCMVAFEKTPQKDDTRQAELHALTLQAVRDSGSPLWLIETNDLIGSFSVPECRSRAQFREVVNGIWPDILLRCANRAVLDAAGLGLFIQAKRLLDTEAASEQAPCAS